MFIMYKDLEDLSLLPSFPKKKKKKRFPLDKKSLVGSIIIYTYVVQYPYVVLGNLEAQFVVSGLSKPYEWWTILSST